MAEIGDTPREVGSFDEVEAWVLQRGDVSDWLAALDKDLVSTGPAINPNQTPNWVGGRVGERAGVSELGYYWTLVLSNVGVFGPVGLS